MKGVKTTLLALCAMGIFLNLASAQELKRCGAEKVNEQYLQEHPEYAVIQQQIERQIQQYIQEQEAFGPKRGAVVTIPVVVHVVHDGDPIGVSENIPEAQILSQIDVLNKDFRKLNADWTETPNEFINLVADVEIEFCLAQQDPDDNPTNGIERIAGTRSNYSANQLNTEIKSIYNWPPSQYLNIYTIRLGGPEASVLGFSSFPGQDTTFDGVAVGYQFFGTTGNVVAPFDMGRTATHEVGHWLGLMHVWGMDNSGCGGSDNITDTPVQDEQYYGCPSHPQVSCGSNDMFMNYMDYTNDSCMSLFTEGQKTRMQAVLNGVRSSILTSNGCVPATIYALDISMDKILFPTDDICVTTFEPKVRFTNRGSTTVTKITFNYQIDGSNLTQLSWTGNIEPNETQTVVLNSTTVSVGSHFIEIWAASPNGGTDEKSSNNQQNLNFDAMNSPGGIFPLPVFEDFNATEVLPSDWTTDNPDNDRTWVVDTAVGANGSVGNCVMFDNHTRGLNNIPNGKIDGLITPFYTFQGVTYPLVRFNLAYAKALPTSDDSLRLCYSTDCGANWVPIWRSGGTDMATAPDTSGYFVPKSSEWKEVIVYLDDRVVDLGKVNFKFENESAGGNNVYLDNFRINEPAVGITPLYNGVELIVYPNPSNGDFNLMVDLEEREEVSFKVLNTLGQEVLYKDLGNTHKVVERLSLPKAGKGLYILDVNVGGKHHYTKLMVH